MPEYLEFEKHKRDYILNLLHCFDRYAEEKRTRLSMWKALVYFSLQEGDKLIEFDRLATHAGTRYGIDAWERHTGIVEKGFVNGKTAYQIRGEFIMAAQSIDLEKELNIR